jgi:hypothetical protein
MASEQLAPVAGADAQPTPRPAGARPWPEEVAGLLGRVAALLDQGRPADAVELLARTKSPSPWARNALGVCQLRLGNAPVAVDVFRGLALGPGGFSLLEEAPTVFKTNYATALLLTDNLEGGLRALAEVRHDQSPATRRLREAVRRWEEGLTFWQKLGWWFGVQPGRPVVLDGPLGDL